MMMESVRNLEVYDRADTSCSSGDLPESGVSGTPPRVCLPVPTGRGGLAPWQVRRAEQLMNENLDRTISLQEMATACRLSTSHFARSFKATMGQAPHRWLLSCRVERAKTLLIESDHPLADIALLCGFSDQSHLARIFSRLVGFPPGTWRRAQTRPDRRSLPAQICHSGREGAAA